MTISQQMNKIEHLAEAIVGKYLMADQERALMEPIVSDESIIQHWNNSLAAHGLEALRMSLYMSVLSAMNPLLFDNYAKTASLYNVCKMLEDERLVGLLRENYCKPFEVNHLNDVLDEEDKRLIEASIHAEHRERAAEDFDQRLKAVREGYHGYVSVVWLNVFRKREIEWSLIIRLRLLRVRGVSIIGLTLDSSGAMQLRLWVKPKPSFSKFP